MRAVLEWPGLSPNTIYTAPSALPGVFCFEVWNPTRSSQLNPTLPSVKGFPNK